MLAWVMNLNFAASGVPDPSGAAPITRISRELVVVGLISEELDNTFTSNELDVTRDSKRNT